MRELRATYHGTALRDLEGLGADVVIECTGLGDVVVGAMRAAAPNAVAALAGISGATGSIELNLDAANKRMALNNGVMFGTVNAARRHYEQAAEALTAAPPSWLARLITRDVEVPNWPDALNRRLDDIKVVVRFDAG